MFADFNSPDFDGLTDRTIDLHAFQKGVDTLGLKITSQQVKDVFNLVDKDGRSFLSCSCAQKPGLNQAKKYIWDVRDPSPRISSVVLMYTCVEPLS